MATIGIDTRSDIDHNKLRMLEPLRPLVVAVP